MEILHAAYRTQSQNAAFFIRSDDFLQDLPPEMMSAFVDVHPLNKGQLKVIRDLRHILKTLKTLACHSFFFHMTSGMLQIVTS